VTGPADGPLCEGMCRVRPDLSLCSKGWRVGMPGGGQAWSQGVGGQCLPPLPEKSLQTPVLFLLPAGCLGQVLQGNKVVRGS
jgi:hypothetical protein